MLSFAWRMFAPRILGTRSETGVVVEGRKRGGCSVPRGSRTGEGGGV